MLKKCLKTGRGITEHNFLDVKTCITMTQDEKLARKAAREMFVTLSNGEDYITSDQLQKHMLEINRERGDAPGELMNSCEDHEAEDEEVDWMGRREGSNEKLTEDNLVAAAVNYSHGELPAVNQILCLSDPDLHALDHIPILQRSVLHPILALKILYFRLIKFLGRRPFFRDFILFNSDFQLLCLIFLYAFISTENMVLFFPLLIYYLSFVIMIITTFQALQTTRDFADFRFWSGLFIAYAGGSLNAQEAEYQFIRNNLKMYGKFFISLLCNLLVYPMIVDQWILQSEFTIIAFCLTFMTLFGFMTWKRSRSSLDFLVLLSFAVNVLAKYPYEIDPVVTQGWRFLDVKIPTFAGYIIGNGIEFCINFRSLFYFFIPFLSLQIATKENWRGTYKMLIPHWVTLSWLQMFMICSQSATMFGLVRGTLALVGIVFFLPLLGLMSIVLPAVALTNWLTSNLTYSILIFTLLFSLGVLLCWVLSRTQYKKYISTIQASLAVLALFVLFNTKQNSLISFQSSQETVQPLSWELYQKFCHQPSWEDSNIASVQKHCLKLADVRISWDGYVNSVKIQSVDNKIKRIVDKLPTTLAYYLSCLYGEQLTDDCHDIPDSDCTTLQDIIGATKKCSLDSYNLYTFEASVRMKSGLWGKSAEVALILDDYFKNFTFSLRTNDHVWFKGRLSNMEYCADGLLGGAKPHVTVEEIGCFACRDSDLTQVKLDRSSKVNTDIVSGYLHLGFKSVLNFLFNPVVVFK